MEANIYWLEAKDMLEKARSGDIELTAAGWFDLTLEVTGSREEAEMAHNAYVRRCYREGRQPQ